MNALLWSKLTTKHNEILHAGRMRGAIVFALLIIMSIASAGIATAAGSWSTKAPYPDAGIFNASAQTIGNKIYVVGGSDIVTGLSTDRLEIYDSVTDTWMTGAPMPTKRLALVTGVIGGKLYVAGGFSNNVGVIQFHKNTLEIYDPATNTWSTAAPMLGLRSSAMGGVIGNKLYVVGGASGCCPSTAHADLFVYDPVTNSWASKAPMAAGTRFGGAAGVVNGKLYVAGGETWPSSPSVTRLEEYDPVMDTWVIKSPMPAVNHLFSTGVINNKFYVIGGRFSPFGDVQRNSVWVYDSLVDSWSIDPNVMPTPRSVSAFTVLNNALHVIGGQRTPPLPATNIHEVFAPAGVSISPSVVAVVDFDSLNTTGGRVSGTALDSYLAGFGITVTNQVGAILTVAPADPSLPSFVGQNVVASSSPNVLEMFPGNTNVSFTLTFTTPLDSLSFTRAARCTSLAFPPWNAIVKDSLGTVIGTASESGGGTGASCASPSPPAQVFSFTTPGIKSLTINSGNFGFYGRQGPALDDLILTLPGGVANTPPIADAGLVQTVECTGSSSANVVLNGSLSSDPDGTIVSYNWKDASNTVIATGVNPTLSLGLGTHTLTLEVTDNDGATASDPVTITVQGTTPPTVNAGADVTLNATGPDGAAFDVLTQTTFSDNCCAVSLSVLPVGSYPIGATTVTISATDCAGNSASNQMIVTVNEVNIVSNLPLPGGSVTISTPPGQTLFNVSAGLPVGGPPGITFPFGTVAFSVTSPVGGNVTVMLNFSLPLPVPFMLFKANGMLGFTLIPTSFWTQTGPNSIQLTLIDGGSFDLDGMANGVIVDPIAIGVDVAAPVITLLGATNVTIEAGSAYSDAGATALDNGDGNITASIATANTVNTATPGSYTVTFNVSDVAGNAATQVVRTVNVVDTTPPVLTVPAPVVDPVAGIVNLGVVTAVDAVNGAVAVSNNAPAVFPVGTTIVTYTATDAVGNTATATQTVTVAAPPPPAPGQDIDNDTDTDHGDALEVENEHEDKDHDKGVKEKEHKEDKD